MISITNIVKQILNEVQHLEWKDIPPADKEEAFKLVDEHNKNIDGSIKGFYYIDVTGKYQVYYTFWRFKEIDPRFAAFIQNPIYMGNLTTNLIDSVKKAVTRMPKTVRLELISDETRKNLIGKTGKVVTFTFGQYRGRPLPEVYLENPSYFAWLAKGANPKYEDTKMSKAIQFFSDMYYEETRAKNLETSKSQHIGKIGDKIEVELEVYGVKEKMDTYSFPNKPYFSYKLKDSTDNKVIANHLEKQFPNIKVGDKVKMKATVKKHLELLGIKFTVLGYITPA